MQSHSKRYAKATV